MLRKVDLKYIFYNLIYKRIETDRRTELHVQGDVDTNLHSSLLDPLVP